MIDLTVRRERVRLGQTRQEPDADLEKPGFLAGCEFGVPELSAGPNRVDGADGSTAEGPAA